MTGTTSDTPATRAIVRAARLGVDWWLARLALGVFVPHVGVTHPLLPVHARAGVDFRDTLEMHLLMDLDELRAHG